MKIFHLITTMDFGGAETQLLQLAQSQQVAGNTVTIFYLKGQGKLLSRARKESELVTIDGRFANQPLVKQIYLLSREVRKENPQVLAAHLPRAELISAVILSLLRRGMTRLIPTRHNTERFWPKGPRVLSRLLSLYVERKSAAVIYISGAVLTFYQDSNESKDFSKSKLVHYGFNSRNTNLENVIENRNDCSKKPKNSPSLRILSVGRLVRQKDFPTLIRALSQLTDLSPHLTIYGAGVELPNLLNLVKRLNLTTSVSFLGQSPSIQDEMKKFDVFVLPSLYEGFGMVLLEACDSGIPIVASRTTAIPEVLGDSYPFLFEVGDASDLEQKIRNVCIANREEIVSYLRSRVSVFDMDKQSKQTLEIYNQSMKMETES